MKRTLARAVGVSMVCAVLAACSGDDELTADLFEAPKTSVSYTVEMQGLPEPEMEALAQDALALYRQREAGAQSIAFLKRRAEADKALLQRVLRSRGYYAGKIEVKVEEITPETPEAEGEEARSVAEVRLLVDPGPAFELKRHDFKVVSGPASAPSAAVLGSPVGAAASAAEIVDAETAAVDQLQRNGYPYAKRLKRRAVADLEAASLEVETPLDSGPSSVFGKIAFSGLEDVRERYLRTYVPWETGDVLDFSKLRTYQRALLATDLFETVAVRIPETPPEARGPVAIPITVTAEERPFRTASAGARYSTDEGPSVSGGLEHRNLFGENEIISAQANVGLQVQRLGIGYREPQYMRPGQDLLASFVVKREEDDAFDDLTATATLGVQRRLTDEWIAGVGVLGEASLITDDGEETTAFLAGVPFFAAYDDTDDLLNPTSGTRFRGEATPFAGTFDGEFAGFFKLDAVASGYVDLLNDDKYILAGRGRFATILAEDIDKVPQTRRLYAGGGGSVRGYAQRFVGALDAQNDPVGGLSALELGAEIRAKVYGDIGGVLFVDAGSVSEETFPAFDNGVQVAAGFGVRYYSPAGPIRLDIAFPLNGRDADDFFQFYFSIGQAF